VICKKPYSISGMQVACRKCHPCLFNRRRIWVHRLLLEQAKSADSCFITLTYDDDHLPEGGSLVPKDFCDYLKRLRRAVEPLKIRFYGVGEYGEKSERPHYHAALFGLGVEFAPLIDQSWKKGFTHVGDLTKDSAAYIAGYVVKKMTLPDDVRLKGRYPEFSRMSRNPGIGRSAVDDIADTLTSDFGVDYLKNHGNIPISLKHGGKDMPLGPYMRKKIREHVGMEETVETPFGPRVKNETKTFDSWKAMQIVRFKIKEIEENPKYKGENPYKVLKAQNSQRALQLETRSKIKKGGSI